MLAALAILLSFPTVDSPAGAIPGIDNLVVTVSVVPERPVSGQPAEIRVRSQDSDPGTQITKIVIDSSDGRRFIGYFTYLGCFELLPPDGLDSTFVLPHTYAKPGQFIARAEVTVQQRVCGIHIDKGQVGVGSTVVVVD